MPRLLSIARLKPRADVGCSLDAGRVDRQRELRAGTESYLHLPVVRDRHRTLDGGSCPIGRIINNPAGPSGKTPLARLKNKDQNDWSTLLAGRRKFVG